MSAVPAREVRDDLSLNLEVAGAITLLCALAVDADPEDIRTALFHTHSLICRAAKVAEGRQDSRKPVRGRSAPVAVGIANDGAATAASRR